MLTFFHIKRNEANVKTIKKLYGLYNYEIDLLVSGNKMDFISQFTLNKNQTFNYFNNYNADTSFMTIKETFYGMCNGK